MDRTRPSWRVDAAELLAVGAGRRFLGRLPDDCNVSGDDSALSVGKAKEVLDWEPEYSWRAAADEEVAGPELVRDG